MDEALKPALREALKQNEIGNSSPYVLSYARKGQSGGSFGMFQGDCHSDPAAKSTLEQVLKAANVDQVTSGQILTAVSAPCPNGDPLPPAQAKLANDALDSQRGHELVDAMDAGTFATVAGYVDRCTAAAATKGWTVAPVAQLYMGLWTNMTGAPTSLLEWLKGKPQLGVPAPAGPAVTQQETEAYLQATTYFHVNPKNFKHMQESVAAGAKLLPQAGGGA